VINLSPLGNIKICTDKEGVFMFINLNEADGLTEAQADEIYRNHFNSALYNSFKLTGLDVHYERAEGMYLWDREGNK
jgi:4-aminobutyrate aminotransferase-like enzyme